MEGWQQAIINAGIMGGLSAFPIWMAYEVIDYTMVKAVIGTFGITFLTLMARYYKPPKADSNNEAILIDPIVSVEGKDPKTKVLGCLWV